MSIKLKAIKGALWTAIQNWVSQAGALVVFFALARLLQPEDFGLVALANVFVAFMQIFLEQGFAQALIQRDELEPEHLDTAFWSNVVIGGLLTGIGFISANGIALLFQVEGLTPVLRCMSIVFLINGFRGTQQAILERQFAFRAIALRSILGICIGGLAGIFAAVSGLGVWSLVIQQLTNELVGTLVLWGASDWHPGFRISLGHFKQLFNFGINILLLNFIGFFNTRMNDFLIGYFLGVNVLGYYAIAYRTLQVLTQLLVRTTSAIALPTFSRLKNQIQRFREAFYTATRLTSVIAFPVFASVIVLAPVMVKLFFGEKWLPCVPLLQMLSIVGMIRSVTFFKSSVLIAAGKPVWTVRLKLLNVTANLIGFSIAYRYGIYAVTMAFVLHNVLLFPISQLVISRIVTIPLAKYIRQFIMPFISSLLMAIIMIITFIFLEHITINYIGILIACTIVGIISYVAILRAIAPSIIVEFIDIFKTVVSNSARREAN